MNSYLPQSIYGPVTSWRLGRSLGVDVLCIDSICSFECVYCQLGKINRLTLTREVFVPTEKILADLRCSSWQSADVITFSGSGEPTLAKNLGEVIDGIRKLTHKPIVVLTNSTLLHREDVRRELAAADKIFCKLDAWSEETLKRFDHPHPEVALDKIILGIHHLRQEFNGFLAIQTMILRPLNEFEIEELADIFAFVRPDEVQLNLPTRPVPKNYFVESRGNEIEIDDSFHRLKTISGPELEMIRAKLAKLTRLAIVTR
jgi:wyosine [tRNA(Phe)-imidazoG37] synthetase (radical SAM superfamily)